MTIAQAANQLDQNAGAVPLFHKLDGVSASMQRPGLLVCSTSVQSVAAHLSSSRLERSNTRLLTNSGWF